MKLHLCCGDIYLDGYANCDLYGILLSDSKCLNNPNKTTLNKYFQYPFEKDIRKRKKREIMVDVEMDILKRWPFFGNCVDEIVMISAFEHFEHLTEIPHIVKEAYRVLKKGGIWKFDFPDIKKQVDEWYGKDDEFMMELIYCNHKNELSMHMWGYTEKTIPNYLIPSNWKLEFKEVVKHDYPMIGVEATKI